MRAIAAIAPAVMPEAKKIRAHEGMDSAMNGLNVTSMARPSEVVTITALRLSRISALAIVCMPTQATLANMAREAPPSTGEGIVATSAPAFGRTPRIIMTTPAPAATHLDFTRVMRTRPTFWAKQV